MNNIINVCVEQKVIKLIHTETMNYNLATLKQNLAITARAITRAATTFKDDIECHTLSL